MTRKTPIKHSVHTYKKSNGKVVQNYVRGKGQKVKTANPNVKTDGILKLQTKQLIDDISEAIAGGSAQNYYDYEGLPEEAYEPESFQIRKSYFLKNQKKFIPVVENLSEIFSYSKHKDYKPKFKGSYDEAVEKLKRLEFK